MTSSKRIAPGLQAHGWNLSRNRRNSGFNNCLLKPELRRFRARFQPCACNPGAIRFDEVMFPYVALSKDKAWQPGPYPGVELMILHTHESTGGFVVLRKFKAGHTIPAHTHAKANEWAYVLSGEWEEIGRAHV